MQDPYKTLGIPYGSSKEEAKKAFRILAHKHHPDKGGDAKKFSEINQAYQQILKMPDVVFQRRTYATTYGHTTFSDIEDFVNQMSQSNADFDRMWKQAMQNILRQKMNRYKF